ncbi:MAG TPA: formate dehydrogenase accessory protein FdhE [Xanthobacteraceae bacterium]|nr:formate dehydrogenase accessory protein FdhE [Xanthobacteraceae bacterium]
MSDNDKSGQTDGPATFEQVGIPERDKPPFVRLPEIPSLFEKRGSRFASLAPGHQLEPFLLFLAEVSRLQHELASEPFEPAMPTEQDLRLRAANAMPTVPREDLPNDPAVLDLFGRLLERAQGIEMPEMASTALGRAQAADELARRAMLTAVVSDAIPMEALPEHIFAAAALQIAAAARSAKVPEEFVHPVADGVCPCCGAPPVTSAIVGWPNFEGSRYVQCSLCSARWNHVRVKCVSCGSTKGIAYQAIEEQPDAIKAETCDNCRTYVKILNERTDPQLDGVADDVASLGLDLLVGEAGWRRAGVNPYLLGY